MMMVARFGLCILGLEFPHFRWQLTNHYIAQSGESAKPCVTVAGRLRFLV